MKASPTDLAWLAGFLDGEGTIGISRTNGKAWKHPYLRPHLQAPNTDPVAIEEMARIIHDVTGKRPSICVSNKGDERWKKAWRVKVSTQWELLLLLPALLPHLRLKRRQAELALEFCQRRAARASYRHYEYAEADQSGYAECIALNRRGPAAEAANNISQLRLVQEN